MRRVLRRRRTRRVLLFLTVGFFLTSTTLYAQADKELIAKGQYLFAIAGGCACHTVPKETYHTGGRAFPIPFGTVFSTNITQDKETGLGDWSERQIYDAINAGRRRDGSRMVPVMPYEAYSGMAQEDLKALIAYMKTLKPVKK
ncbi:MAG TPA: c-type cytochrome, partial [Candidatus Binatia bacterium]